MGHKVFAAKVFLSRVSHHSSAPFNAIFASEGVRKLGQRVLFVLLQVSEQLSCPGRERVEISCKVRRAHKLEIACCLGDIVQGCVDLAPEVYKRGYDSCLT